MDAAAVGLSAAIEALRAELTDALAQARDQGMRFRLDPIELTVQAVVTKEANGKIGWSILGLGGSYESAVTQSLKLRLTPIWQGPDGTQVDDFTIADLGSTGDSFGPHE
jgi:Trypsin-co-occurring domain 2